MRTVCQLYVLWWPSLGVTTGGTVGIAGPMSRGMGIHTRPMSTPLVYWYTCPPALWYTCSPTLWYTHVLDIGPLDIAIPQKGPGTRHTPCEQADACENITLPKNSFAVGKNRTFGLTWADILLELISCVIRQLPLFWCSPGCVLIRLKRSGEKNLIVVFQGCYWPSLFVFPAFIVGCCQQFSQQSSSGHYVWTLAAQ